ncbi:hypothetical protein [Corynebacterium pilosum]|uniref:Uncharacterized protein n=1 Tax=Corynebacterium pilosum TaxID=35756 RepID=A0A376CLC2_9CORY|nr:hypothetical protein [Corynebacterium pilosum]STC68909.1 Uncharacterised protein [Corynebacterium pilosum]
MRLILLSCVPAGHTHPTGAENMDVVQLPEVPSRKDLSFLDSLADEVLPHDPTPSLDEIAAQPDVAHMGTPQPAPQPIENPVRVIVHGSDAALSAVLTRMMRADYMWMQIAYIPTDFSSPAAINWGLTSDNAWDTALRGNVRPVPTIRTDTSTVVAGSATLTRFSLDDEGPAAGGVGEYIGEIVVDSDVLIHREDDGDSAKFFGQFGARLVPMTDAPGIVAAPLVTPRESQGRSSSRDPQQLQAWSTTPGLRWRTRNQAVAKNRVDGSRMLTGRAVQSGGLDILITIDGVPHPRPVKRVTFYRHLRDMQAVRP